MKFNDQDEPTGKGVTTPQGIIGMQGFQGSQALMDPTGLLGPTRTLSLNEIKMNWSATIIGYPKTDISVYLSPEISAKYNTTSVNNREPVAVAIFTILTNPTSSESVEEESEFVKLTKAAMIWAFNAYFNNGTNILNQMVGVDDVQRIINYLNDKNFSCTSFNSRVLLEDFFGKFFNTVMVKALSQEQDGLNSSIFPFFPVLSMELPNNEDPKASTIVNFQTQDPYTSVELEEIKKYLSAIQVQQSGLQARYTGTEEGSSLAEYFFVDYFLMLLKYGFDAIKELFQQTTETYGSDESLQDLIDKHQHYGKTLEEIGFANRHKNLNCGIEVKIPSVRYRLKHGEDSVEVLAERYPHVPNAIWKKAFDEQLLMGEVLNLQSFSYQLKEEEQHTLRSLATLFNTDTSSIVRENSETKNLFIPSTRLIIPMVGSITIGALLEKLNTADNHRLDNLGGTLTRFYLHGLRIPDKDNVGKRKGFFEALGQQFSPIGFVNDNEIAISVNEQNKTNAALDWLTFEDPTSKRTSFKITHSLVTKISGFQTSTLVPSLQLVPQEAILHYKLLPKTFPFTDKIIWDNPNPFTSRPNTLGNCFAWKFTHKLQQLLSLNGKLNTMLKYQSFNSQFSVEVPKVIEPLFWATSIEVNISRIPSGTDASKNLDFVYNMIGCGENDSKLISTMISDKAFAPESIYFLYGKDKTLPNAGQVSSLTSSPQANWQAFLVQTTPSTESNLPTFHTPQLGEANNLIGMNIKTFLTCLLECSIVNSGGYYFYYNDTVAKNGFPDYIFDQHGNATITMLVSYSIEDQKGEKDETYYTLPVYVNQAVITQDFVPIEDNIYIEPYLTSAQQLVPNTNLLEQIPITFPGHTICKGIRDNPDLLAPSSPTEEVEKQLKQLFSLLEYYVEAKPDEYIQGDFALPVEPTKSENLGQGFCLGKSLSLIKAESLWRYELIIPIFPFSISNPADPYSSNQKPANIAFNFLDIFGNTLANDANGALTQNQQVTNRYTDALIGVDQWPAVAKSYTFIESESEPVFSVDFTFDVKAYTTKGEDGTITIDIEKAVRDEKKYQQIEWQISQTDVEICISNTLDQVSVDCKKPTQTFVGQIISTLKTIQTGILPTEVVSCNIKCKINTVIETVIFCLKLAIEINRKEVETIDPQFLDVANVRFASSFIPPGFYGEDAMVDFATHLETVFPFLKVGTLKIIKTEEEQSNNEQVWITRWQYTTETQNFDGIKFKVLAPSYFAIKPLSTELVSRPGIQKNRTVPIRIYNGVYLAKDDNNLTQMAFSGVDMQLWAQVFLTAIERFYTPEISTLAWQIQNLSPKASNELIALDPETSPFSVVEAAKRKIAAAIANHQLTNVLEETLVEANLTLAKEALKQRLLVKLSDANIIASVVQAGVGVTGNTVDATVFGALKLQNEASTPKPFSFSSSKLSLLMKETAMGTFFDIRDRASSEVRDYRNFEASLNWHITSLAHNFKPRTDDYQPSSKLTFVKPLAIKNETTPLITANIPIPLNVYPATPVFQSHQASESIMEDGKTIKEKLVAAKEWDYTFEFEYNAAAQDAIYANVIFNGTNDLESYKNDLGLYKKEELDLFDALAQFNAVYQVLLKDMKANSKPAFQSFAWAVKQVSDTWSNWSFGTLDLLLAEKKVEVNFKITEQKDKTNGVDLLIKVEKIGEYPFATLPTIFIGGLLVDKISEGTYKYYLQKNPKERVYLKFIDRNTYPRRAAVIEKCDILNYGNAWAGVSVCRNEDLIDDKITNPAFIYKIPFLRFTDRCVPMIFNNNHFDIAAFSTNTLVKRQLSEYLIDFFLVLFNGHADQSQNIVQLVFNYSYAIQESDAYEESEIRATLPILNTVPSKCSKELILAIEEQVVARWLKMYNPQGIKTNGRLEFMLSVFSSLTDANVKTPILKLTELHLDTKLIKLD